MMTSEQFQRIPEFEKDYNRLCRKYHHFDEDFERFKKALRSKLPNHLSGTFRISGLGDNIKIPIYKVKKFRSFDLRGKGAKSGFRIIYAHKIDTNQIIFIEAYHKSKQSNESRDRIYKYFSSK